MSAEQLTRDQLRQLLAYARHIEDGRLVAVCMRAIDGDSMYHSSIMERCAAAYAGAHMSDEFKHANRTVDNEPGQPQRKPRRKP
jgi:hypothetical protein